MSGAQSAREEARKGRVEQLNVLAAFEASKPVKFKVHNNPGGYPLKKAECKKATSSGKKVEFEQETIFLDGALNGYVETVNDCIGAGVDVHAVDADGMTALHKACLENYLPMVCSLLDKGADPNRQDNDWWTPVHAAAHGGHWRILNKLFDKGGDPTMVNCEGDLPIDLVGDARTEKVVSQQMKNHGVDPTDEDSVNAIRDKSRDALLEDIKEAIPKGLDLNKTYAPGGATFLHIAACNGYLDVCQYIMEQKGVNPSIGDEAGNTPLHLAVFFMQYETVMLLVAKGADLRATNNLRQKPIILAEDDTMIRLLTALEKKLDASKEMSSAKSKPKYSGSISRQSRKVKGDQSRKDAKGESQQMFN